MFDENGGLLYNAEVPPLSPGLRQTFIQFEDSMSLAGREVVVRLRMKNGVERNLRDNDKVYTLPWPGASLSSYFNPMPGKVRLGNTVSTTVELTYPGHIPKNGSISMSLRNRHATDLVTSILGDSVMTLAPQVEARREFYLDIAVRDTLSGLRYADYVFIEGNISSTLGFTKDAKVNPSSFKVVCINGNDSGVTYPLNVKTIRQGQVITGYRIQWPIKGFLLSDTIIHRLYFSYNLANRYSDVNFVGDEIYSINSQGSLYKIQASNGILSAPVLLQVFPGTDSARSMRVSAGDFNEDGINDIVYTDKNKLLLRFGDSLGTFGAPQLLKENWTSGWGQWPINAVGVNEPIVVDINGDGHLDILAMAIPNSNGLSLYGTGAGAFTTGYSAFYGYTWSSSPGDVFRPVGWISDLVAIGLGDLSHIVFSQNRLFNIDSITNRYLHYGNGAGQSSKWGGPSNGLNVADFNNDGREDMLSNYHFNKWGADPGNTMDGFTARFEVPPTVAYWKGIGVGEFEPTNGMGASHGSENGYYGLIPTIKGWTEIGSMDNTDFNGDGNEDVILSEGSVPYRTIVYPGNGDFTFGSPEVLGYDSVGVFGLHVAYRRTLKTIGTAPHANRNSQNSVSLSWNSILAGPGEYDLEAWWKEGGDSLLIGRSAPIRILPALNVDVSLSSDKPSFGEGDEFSGSVILTNTDNQYTASSLRISVSALLSGNQTSLYDFSNHAIGQSSSYEIPVRFRAQSGMSLLVVVAQEGLSDTTLIPIAVSATGHMDGRITFGAYEGIETFRNGQGLSLSLFAKNTGSSFDSVDLLLIRQNLSTLMLDTVFAESGSFAAGDSVVYFAPISMSLNGAFRLIWLAEGMTLDSRSFRVLSGTAPQIVKVFPPQSSEVSAGSLLDIWVDAGHPLSEVSVLQGNQSRTAIFIRDTLGYKVYQDTIMARQPGAFSIGVSAVDEAGGGPSTGMGDNNPLSLSFVYTSEIQPFAVSGVRDGDVSPRNYQISVRPNPNLIRFPESRLNGELFSVGAIANEGNHELVLSGILNDGRSYSKSIAFALDKSGPTITVENIANGQVFDHEVSPIIRVSDLHGVYHQVFIDGRVWDGGSVSAGNHSLLVSARDSLENANDLRLSFEVVLPTGKFVRINPPLRGSHHNRTVHPGIETNLDDILNMRVGLKNTALYDTTEWFGFTESIKSDSLTSWTAGAITDSWWKRADDTSFYGFGPDGHYYAGGVKSDSLATWASEMQSETRGPGSAFPESLIVVSSDSGIFLFNSANRSLWMRFNIAYGRGNNNPIHRPLYNLKFEDGWLIGFWDDGFIAVSFVDDKLIGWNRNTPKRYFFSWKGVSGRNSSAPPVQEFLSTYSDRQIGFQDMRKVKAYVRRWRHYTILNLSSSQDGTFSYPVYPVNNGSIRTLPTASIWGFDEAFATSNGKTYRFASYGNIWPYYGNNEIQMDTMGLNQFDYNGNHYEYLTPAAVQTGHSPEYRRLAPDVWLADVKKAFGHDFGIPGLRSLSFLTSEYLQTTYYNYFSPSSSPLKRTLKVGAAPTLPQGQTGLNHSAWQVEKGKIILRDGLLFVDTSIVDTAKERMRISEREYHLADFQAEFTVRNTDPFRANNYLRVAFKDSTGTERITLYFGAQVSTSRHYGNSYYPKFRWITAGYGLGDRTEMQHEIHSMPASAPAEYKIRIKKTDGVYRLFVWGQDKWEEKKVYPSANVRKAHLKMEISSWCQSGDNFGLYSEGNPTIGFRVDSYEELNTTYFPEEVQSLVDAVPLKEQLIFRSQLQSGSIQHFAFDTTARSLEPLHAPFAEDTHRRILLLGPGRFISQDGNRFTLVQKKDIDPIMPFDSVSEEGRHTLLAEVTSRSRGVFRDTSRFVIDKTPPSVMIYGVLESGIYHASVTPLVSIQDLFFDSSRSQLTLNGVSYQGAAITRNGAYALRVKAVDSSGNVRDTTLRFTLADKLRRLRPNSTLTLLEDASDSSLNVTTFFAPSNEVEYRVLQAPNLATGLMPNNHLFIQPAPNFTGIRDVIISAMFEGATIYDTLRVIVSPEDSPPRLLTSDTVKGVGGQAVSHRIVVQDPDDQVAFTVSGLPTWLTLQGEVLTGVSPINGDTSSATLNVSAGMVNLSVPLYIRISGNNTPPFIAPRFTVSPSYSNQSLTLDLRGFGHDVEDDTSTLTWSWGSNPNLMITPGVGKDQFIVHPASGFSDTVTVQLTLYDPHGAFFTQAVLFDFSLTSGPVTTFLKHWFPMREGQGMTASDIRGGLSFSVPSASWSQDTGLVMDTMTSTDPTPLHVERGLSLETWVKLRSFPSSDLEILTLSQSGFGLLRIVVNGQNIRVDEALSDTVLSFTFANALPRDNVWQHLVVSMKDDSVALYRNGTLFRRMARPNFELLDMSPSITLGEGPFEVALLRVYEKYLTPFIVRHNYEVAERQAGLTLVNEAEEPFGSRGAEFTQTVFTALPSRIALGTSDSVAQQCLFTPADSNFLEFKLYVPVEGTYFLLGKTRGKVYDNSFFVQVDGGLPQIWDLPFDGRFGVNWFKEINSQNPLPLHLVQGDHKFRIYAREGGTLLDWVGLASRNDLRLRFVENPRWK